jgi:hypothetical protein
MQLYYALDSPIGKSVPPKRGRSDYVFGMTEAAEVARPRPVGFRAARVPNLPRRRKSERVMGFGGAEGGAHGVSKLPFRDT